MIAKFKIANRKNLWFSKLEPISKTVNYLFSQVFIISYV